MRFNWRYWRRLLQKGGSREPIEAILKARANLPHKSQLVLDIIWSSGPTTVSRAEIIDECWDGNALVGDKGLTHALWTIRLALQDNARHPRFIRTISRTGYSWIGPVQQDQKQFVWLSRQPQGAIALVSVFMLFISAFSFQTNTHFDNTTSLQKVKAPDGKSIAYFQGRDIIVERDPGIKLVMRPKGQKRFGNPSYSRDGDRLAFNVYNAGQCELIVFALEERSYKKFEECPV